MKKALAVLREVTVFAWSRKLSTLLVLLLAAAICVLGILTAGRTAVAGEQLDRMLDATGSRTLEVTSMKGSGLIPPNVIAVTASLSPVISVLGLSTAVDAPSGHRGGITIPTWIAYGDLSQVVTLTAGRWPNAGEAIVCEDAQQVLALDGSAGYLIRSGTEIPIVGIYTVTDPFFELHTGALIAPWEGAVGAIRLIVEANDYSQARWVERETLAILAPPDRRDIQVKSPMSLADLQAEANSGFSDFAQQLFMLVLSLGVGVIALVVLVDVLLLRSDLGRRRALGATRQIIAALVIGRTLIPAIFGATLGSGIGLALGIGQEIWPSPIFTLGVATLCLLASFQL